MNIHTFAEMSPSQQWHTVVKLVNAKEHERGYIRIYELVSEMKYNLGIDPERSLQYLREFLDTGKWQTWPHPLLPQGEPYFLARI